MIIRYLDPRGTAFGLACTLCLHCVHCAYVHVLQQPSSLHPLCSASGPVQGLHKTRLEWCLQEVYCHVLCVYGADKTNSNASSSKHSY